MSSTDETVIDSAQLEAQRKISQIVERTGLPPSEIARRAGLSPSTLTRLYPVSTVRYTLSARTLAKLAAAFPMNDDTSSEGEKLQLSADSKRGPEAGKAGVLLLRSASSSGQELDVYDGELSGVSPLRIVPDAYPERYLVAYMPSDCMEPRIRAGEVLLIDRLIPPATLSDIVVELKADDQCEAARFCVGQLAAHTRDAIEIRQLQGGVSATIAKVRIKALNAIVGRFDRALLG